MESDWAWATYVALSGANHSVINYDTWSYSLAELSNTFLFDPKDTLNNKSPATNISSLIVKVFLKLIVILSADKIVKTQSQLCGQF
jgi:hypothetical protein